MYPKPHFSPSPSMTDMMFERPPRKRAGTKNFAAPMQPAQRAKPYSLKHQKSNNLIFPRQDNHYGLPNQGQENLPTAPQSYKPNIVTIPSPKLGSARLSKPAVSRSTTSHMARDEFPFPTQRTATPTLMNNHLHLVIPQSEPAAGITNPLAPELHPNSRSVTLPLPTPPRSHPSIPTLFSSSPPSGSFDVPAPSYPPLGSSHSSSNSNNAIPVPPTPRTSLSSTYTSSTYQPSASPSFSSTSTCTTLPSPLSPLTPTSPHTVFDSAAASLKRLLMADDLGMTPDEIKELSDFAGSQAQKRNGRVLVKKKVMMGRDSLSLCHGYGANQRWTSKETKSCRGGGRSGSGADRGSVSRSSMEVHSPAQADGQGQAQTWWREVNWSRFSDSSTSASSLSSGLAPFSHVEPESAQSQQNREAFDFDAGLDVDSQDEGESGSGGEEYMSIDGSPLGTHMTHTAVAVHVGKEGGRRGLDLTRSLPDKVDMRTVGGVFEPCAGGYCCGSCGRCTWPGNRLLQALG